METPSLESLKIVIKPDDYHGGDTVHMRMNCEIFKAGHPKDIIRDIKFAYEQIPEELREEVYFGWNCATVNQCQFEWNRPVTAEERKTWEKENAAWFEKYEKEKG